MEGPPPPCPGLSWLYGARRRVGGRATLLVTPDVCQHAVGQWLQPVSGYSLSHAAATVCVQCRVCSGPKLSDKGPFGN
jgi:hypothetical protein